MYVDEIQLNDFRNYKDGYAAFSQGVNVIYGGNARGKTNILEAVYLLSSARSHRLSRENEMIRFGEKTARITAKFHSRGRDNIGEMTLFPDKKKQIKINRVPIGKTSGLMGFLNTVMFCPEDLRLVKGSPRERRRMMDLGICQLSKKYFHALSQYVKVLEQRNRLLKENPGSQSLWVWDEKLVQYGVEVMLHRKRYLATLGGEARNVHGGICGERLDVAYRCGAAIGDFDDREAAARQFLADLERCHGREQRFGMSLSGPHRDDFSIVIDDREARLYGSQGQQRTAALSLKMAEVSLLRDGTGETPVLLLDDVMSELDLSRQSYILNHIGGVQVIITCTAEPDRAAVFYENAKKINVEEVKR
ncbi:MAG: DNA replication/repair protein RecF [Clostridiales bacterium]|jgi:DNA replication and repair protein RecF|nr:DNA replication/repair protein RecF [Clostridiales bacterium]